MTKTTTARRSDLRLETLEAREVMTASIVAGTLKIVGTAYNDTVAVTQVGTVVTVTENGVRKNFAAASIIGGVRFEGGAGNDVFSNGTALRCVALGGSGKDVLRGGSGHDVLWGGDGDDRLYGNGGTDQLFGESGNDFLDSGSLAPTAADLHAFDGGAGMDFLAHRPVVGGVNVNDVQQRGSPTCATLASIAAAVRAGVNFSSRISYLGNDVYRVKLFQKVGSAMTARNIDVTFNGTVANTDAAPHGENATQEGDFWATLVHRAYLKMDPAAADGTWPNKPLEAMTGRSSDSRFKVGNWYEGSDTPFGRVAGNPDHLQNLLASGKAVVAGTYADSDFLVSPHAYAVTKVERVNGTWFVTLYNPHGQDGGATASGAADDGVIRLTWAQFNRGVDYYYFA